MLILSLFWLVLGVLIGALALGARMWTAAWGTLRRKKKVAALLVLGASAALLGGWLGTLIWGRLFGTPTALWVSVVFVALGPWLWVRLRARAQSA